MLEVQTMECTKSC